LLTAHDPFPISDVLGVTLPGDDGDHGDLSSVALAKEDNILKRCPSDLQPLSRFSE
jgi:hypothetical protein